MAKSKNTWLITLIAPLLILIIPLLAMQFTEEVQWEMNDFIIAGILLFFVSIIVKVVAEKVKTRKPKMITIVLIIIAFLLIWAELAVGVFGSPLAGS